ncbi:MAG: EpsD family peptidyl-prolyl cis-trans isomerase [Proteobacteria bacterium]|nr:EpsD family peptidyl-prolyl cis-trans isomerase [Pseudomonadota bacterium]
MMLRRLTLALLTTAALAAGCGEKKKEPLPGNQVAARVNKDDVTLQQINLVLQQQRNLRPEQADQASRQILERLIDQELAVQKAESLKLDAEPRVQQLLDAARREVVARAYAEKVSEGAAKPSPDEVHQYYVDKPALFSERRVYSIQELAIEARADQVATLRERLAASKTITEFVDHLKANDYRFSANQAVRSAEQLPMPVLEALARMKDGQASVNQGSNGLVVTVLAGSRSQPVSEEQARPAIEQYLLNERKRKLVEEDLKALRAAAKIEYVGSFADAARPPASAASR